MLWYIFFGIIGVIFFKKKYSLSFWQAIWNGILFGFTLYFSWGLIISVISLVVGLEVIPIWAILIYALATLGGIKTLMNLRKSKQKKSDYGAGSNKNQKINQEYFSNIPGGVIETSVAGVTFEGRQELIRKLRIGEPISLEREVENRHDFNAIKIVTESGAHIGYINRDLAERLAPIIDESGYRKMLIGEILSMYRIKNDNSIIGVRIKFQLPEKKDEVIGIDEIEIYDDDDDMKSFPICPNCGQNDKVARIKDIVEYKKDSPILISKLSPPSFDQLEASKEKVIPELKVLEKPKLIPAPRQPYDSVYGRLFIFCIILIILSLLFIIPIGISTDLVITIPIIILSIILVMSLIFLYFDNKEKPKLKKKYLEDKKRSQTINEKLLIKWQEEVNKKQREFEVITERIILENQIKQENYKKEKMRRERLLECWGDLIFCYRDDSIFLPGEDCFGHVDNLYEFLLNKIK